MACDVSPVAMFWCIEMRNSDSRYMFYPSKQESNFSIYDQCHSESSLSGAGSGVFRDLVQCSTLFSVSTDLIIHLAALSGFKIYRWLGIIFHRRYGNLLTWQQNYFWNNIRESKVECVCPLLSKLSKSLNLRKQGLQNQTKVSGQQL